MNDLGGKDKFIFNMLTLRYLMKCPGSAVSGSQRYKSGIQVITRSWRDIFESHQHICDVKLFKSRG